MALFNCCGSSYDSLVQEEKLYVKEALCQNEVDGDHRACVTIRYIRSVLEAATKIISDIDVKVHIKPFKYTEKDSILPERSHF